MKKQSVTIESYTTVDGRCFLNDRKAAQDHEEFLNEKINAELDLREFVKINERWGGEEFSVPWNGKGFMVVDVQKEQITIQDPDTKETFTKNYSNWMKNYRHQLLNVIENSRLDF